MTLIVSHCTQDYAMLAARMAVSAHQFKATVILTPMPDLGSWAANCRIRAAYLLGLGSMFNADGMWWIDADAELKAPLPEPPSNCDIGVHFHHIDNAPSPGTLYVSTSEEAFRFLAAWNEETGREGTDKDSFQAALERCPDLRVWNLPETLCYIPDLAKTDEDPIDPACDCPTCQAHSRAYLRHLCRTGEVSFYRLATLHNLRFLVRLMREIRSAIADDRLDTLRSSWGYGD